MKLYRSHDLTMTRTASIAPLMAFDGTPGWYDSAREKLTELLGMPGIGCDDCFSVTAVTEKEGCREVEFEFQSEPGYYIPCHLLIPKGAAKPLPAAICLQGHTTGKHVSLGQKKFEKDTDEMVTPRSFALQAVSHGLCAIVMDQRYMGSAGQDAASGKAACLSAYPALSALLWGRTVIGERVWDIMRLIDVIENRLGEHIDPKKLICLGTSGGGTAAYYAAALESRIHTAVVSCALCTYEQSIMSMYHCPCNYIPGIRKYFEMGDVGCLIAPRKLLVYSGESDNIFPLDGAKSSFETVRSAYAEKNDCRMLTSPGGHGFAPELVWPVALELLNKA